MADDKRYILIIRGALARLPTDSLRVGSMQSMPLMDYGTAVTGAVRSLAMRTVTRGEKTSW